LTSAEAYTEEAGGLSRESQRKGGRFQKGPVVETNSSWRPEGLTHYRGEEDNDDLRLEY